jgi:hypothetical protein
MRLRLVAADRPLEARIDADAVPSPPEPAQVRPRQRDHVSHPRIRCVDDPTARSVKGTKEHDVAATGEAESRIEL